MLFTVGHSNRSIEEFLTILTAFGITHVVDVRRFPMSRSQPQFNGEALSRALSRTGIGYSWSEALGGRRGKDREADPHVNAGWEHQAFHNYADYALTPSFRAGLRQLLALSERETCAVMCAEALWWRCHRRIIADYAMANGVSVMHIFTATKAEPAKPTPFGEVARGRIFYREPGAAFRNSSL